VAILFFSPPPPWKFFSPEVQTCPSFSLFSLSYTLIQKMRKEKYSCLPPPPRGFFFFFFPPLFFGREVKASASLLFLLSALFFSPPFYLQLGDKLNIKVGGGLPSSPLLLPPLPSFSPSS